MKVTAAQPPNATAAWPDGSPPRSGVPVPNRALIPITSMMTTAIAITVTCGGECWTVSMARLDGVERAGREVDRLLERRVDHLGDEDERDREHEREHLEPARPEHHPERQDGQRHDEVDAHVALGAHHVDHALERVVEARDQTARLAAGGRERRRAARGAARLVAGTKDGRRQHGRPPP